MPPVSLSIQTEAAYIWSNKKNYFKWFVFSLSNTSQYLKEKDLEDMEVNIFYFYILFLCGGLKNPTSVSDVAYNRSQSFYLWDWYIL